jgi:agmatinase
MKRVFVPGINGLGKTKGCELNLNYIPDPESFERIKTNNKNVLEQLSEISEKTKKYFNHNGRVFFFGGDHSISFPLVRNFFEKFGNQARLIVFDAHPDLMKPMPEPTHEEWVRAVVELGFKPENILIAGVRRNSENIDKKEIKFAKDKGISLIYSDDFGKRTDEIIKFAKTGILYVSLDIDVFDSSLISKTGYPEAGGLSKGFFDLFNELSLLGGFKFLDLVEMNLSLKSSNDQSPEFYKELRRIFEKQ